MISKEGLNMKNILYLLLYNLIFVAPLLIILFLAAFGLSIEKIEDWRKKNRNWMRIVIGAGMVALGLLMIFGAI
jgi:cytochrome c biogenesis protein CcdA